MPTLLRLNSVSQTSYFVILLYASPLSSQGFYAIHIRLDKQCNDIINGINSIIAMHREIELQLCQLTLKIEVNNLNCLYFTIMDHFEEIKILPLTFTKYQFETPHS